MALTQSNKRDSGVDSLAGFFVIYIAVGHALNLYHLPNYNMCPSPFLYFFMPWFFYKGGMYFRHKDDKTALLQNFKRLIKPFIIWSIAGCLVFNLLSLLFQSQMRLPLIWIKEMIADGSIYENKPLWFLLSLFIVKTISNKFAPPNRKNLLILSIIFGLLIASFGNYWGCHIPLWLFNSSSGLVFFLIGYLVGCKYNWGLFILSSIIWLAISIFIPVGVNMRANETNYGQFYLWWPYSIAGIYTVNFLIKLVPLGVIESKFNLLRVAGIYSMEIYVIHWILLLIPIAVGLI